MVSIYGKSLWYVFMASLYAKSLWQVFMASLARYGSCLSSKQRKMYCANRDSPLDTGGQLHASETISHMMEADTDAMTIGHMMEADTDAIKYVSNFNPAQPTFDVFLPYLCRILDVPLSYNCRTSVASLTYPCRILDVPPLYS